MQSGSRDYTERVSSPSFSFFGVVEGDKTLKQNPQRMSLFAVRLQKIGKGNYEYFARRANSRRQREPKFLINKYKESSLSLSFSHSQRFLRAERISETHLKSHESFLSLCLFLSFSHSLSSFLICSPLISISIRRQSRTFNKTNSQIFIKM